MDAKLPGLICTVGSVRLPSTTNAIERFFRAFPRFYATRGGFHSVRSATRELVLFLVVYVFTQHATTGQAPIEVIVPEARRMPLYRLINDPFRALQERKSVQSEATWQICCDPRRPEPSWDAGRPSNTHLPALQPSHTFRLTPGHIWSSATASKTAALGTGAGASAHTPPPARPHDRVGDSIDALPALRR